MKKFKTFLALILVVTVFAALFVGCGKKQQTSTDKDKYQMKQMIRSNGKKEESHGIPCSQ